MKNSQDANAFLRLFKKRQTNGSPRTAAAVPKRARQATTNCYAHLCGAPRAALERMIDRPTSADPWGAVHARAIGSTGARASSQAGAKQPGADGGWNAAAKRIGADR